MSVGVNKARVAFNSCGVFKPAPRVTETDSNPIRVAPAVAAVVKTFSLP